MEEMDSKMAEDRVMIAQMAAMLSENCKWSLNEGRPNEQPSQS